MCLAVCNKKLGGCGYLGDDQEWVREGEQYLCPNCSKDRMYFLFDYNVEAVVEVSILKKAKNMLDEYYTKLNGKSYDAHLSADISLHTA